MKKLLISTTIFLFTCIFVVCGCTQSNDKPADKHRHSILPGSSVCESCGEEVVICPECQMVSGADDTQCWFCKSSLE